MAKITTVTNPLTGQPAQVDQLEHTAQQIDDAVAASTVESTDYTGCYYRMVGSVVEWVNPPMALGAEYRTTERYQGKPVFVRLVNCGKLTVTAPEVNKTELIVDNIDAVISCTATDATSAGWSFPNDMIGYVMSDKTTISCSARWSVNAERHGILQIITAKTYPNNWTNNIIAMVKYTKSVN